MCILVWARARWDALTTDSAHPQHNATQRDTGYRYVPSEGRWDNTHVFPKWRAKYPEPPDLVGITRIYEK
jgi:hypothetical protein